jgi:hypothetical protein
MQVISIIYVMRALISPQLVAALQAIDGTETLDQSSKDRMEALRRSAGESSRFRVEDRS